MSVNEQLAPPSKQRLSPLEFRNTDLVSRLLAATPPYLYNMSLLPNTYFFSEMLRSFVQAKSEPSTRSFPTRRTRKRPWTSLKNESTTPPKLEQPNDWSMKNYTEVKNDAPLELTTMPKIDNENDRIKTSSFNEGNERKIEVPLQDSIFSPMSQENNHSGLILPPPPPIWYPPMYPTGAPYGIDPLHFFIDLRVSGHIYDRKNQREEANVKPESEDKRLNSPKETAFKQSRHASAFSVPTPRPNRSLPINLSQGDFSDKTHQEPKNIKFDVKSMGFEKTCNRIGTSYIISNIGNIYKNVNEEMEQKVKNEENDNESEEEKQKRVKNLGALFGLELVVDYMNHAKPQPKRPIDENHDSPSTNSESGGSPNVEVVAVQDET